MMNNKLKKFNLKFRSQTILLLFSIALGLGVLVLSGSYAYYILELSISDDKPGAIIQTANTDLTIEPVSGELKLCKNYPISDSEAANCTPYVLDLINDTEHTLTYRLNLEIDSPDIDDLIRVDVKSCSGTSCVDEIFDSYLISLSQGEDIVNEGFTGYILDSQDISPGDTLTYKVTVWLDSTVTSVSSVSSVNMSITAVSVVND